MFHCGVELGFLTILSTFPTVKKNFKKYMFHCGVELGFLTILSTFPTVKKNLQIDKVALPL